MMNFKKKQKGFTFVEIIVAVFIFSLMMVAVTGIFSSSVGGYKTARVVQKDLEDAQFIMNRMAKILRTSSVVDNPADGQSLVILNYSQGECLKYAFTEEKIKVGKTDIPPPGNTPQRIAFDGDPIAWCRNNLPGNLDSMAALNVTGKFFAVSSDKNSGDEELGKVTVLMTICSDSSCTADKVNIQTSVSLRDYYNAGI